MYYNAELQIINLKYSEIFSIHIAYILPNASFLVLWLASTLSITVLYQLGSLVTTKCSFLQLKLSESSKQNKSEILLQF